MTDPWRTKMLAKLADGSLLRDLESQRSPEEIVGEWLAGDERPPASILSPNTCSPAVPPTTDVDRAQNGPQPNDHQTLARHFGAARARQGIYPSEDSARRAFAALYGATCPLTDAALAGWLEVGA